MKTLFWGAGLGWAAENPLEGRDGSGEESAGADRPEPGGRHPPARVCRKSVRYCCTRMMCCEQNGNVARTPSTGAGAR